MRTAVRLFSSRLIFFGLMLLTSRHSNQTSKTATSSFSNRQMRRQMTVAFTAYIGLRAGRYKVATGRSDDAFTLGLHVRRVRTTSKFFTRM